MTNIPYEDYTRHLLRSKTGFFTFSRHYTKIMDLDEAAFVQHLLNHASCDWIKSDENGFFECTNAQITTALHLSDDSIKYLLKKLKRRGFISTDLRGLPAKRYIKVHILLIEKSLDEWDDKLVAEQHDKLVVSSLTGKGDFPQHLSSIGFNDFVEKHKYCPGDEPLEEPDVIEPVFVINKSTQDTKAPKVVEDITIFDRECATRLLRGLQAKGLVPKKAIKSSTSEMYASSFVVLRNQLDNDTDRIEEVLDWYIPNIGGDFIPQALAASSFVTKFHQLELAMKRQQSQPATKTTPPAGMVFTEDTKEIYSLIKRYAWPKITENDLLILIQTCFDRYADFRKRVNNYGTICRTTEGRNKATSLQMFANALVDDIPGKAQQGRMTDVFNFVHQWMLQTYERVADWQDWSGSINSVVFHVNSKQFIQDGRSYSMRWCGDSNLWDQLVQEVMK